MGVYLSSPDTRKHTTSGETDYLSYCESSMQGWRLNQEDGVICQPSLGGLPNAALFAVFDGHGGAEVARFCSKHFEKQLLSCQAF